MINTPYDGSSAAGKATTHVQGLASAAGVPVTLVAGRIADDAPALSFVRALSLTDLAGSTREALGDPRRWLQQAGAILARG